MKLYYNPLSTYSQKALIALYEKGVDFERELVNLMSPEGREAYERVYPLGKIPLMVVNGDHMIPESTTIIEYLEGHHGHQGTRLIPEGVDAARQARFMDRMTDLYLNNPVVTLLFNKFGFRQYDEATLATAAKHLRISYGHLDQRLATQPWLAGAQFTMADCAAIPPLYYARYAAPFSDHPHLSAYFERAQQRASYARVMSEFVPIWQGMVDARKASA